MILTGALVNGVAIIAGGLAGTLGGKLMPERMKQTLPTAAALLAMGIGISGLSSSNNQLIPILSLILGTIVGELLNIEHAVERMGAWLQKKFSGMGRITEGFVTGTLVFAVGAMAVMRIGQRSGERPHHPVRQIHHRLRVGGGLRQLYGHRRGLCRRQRPAGGGAGDDSWPLWWPRCSPRRCWRS